MLEAGYTVLIKQVDEWWIGWVEEVPGVNAQERTRADLRVSLREALREAIEFNREEAKLRDPARVLTIP